ncbi:MAG: ATP-dependent DNA helicase RecQ [Hormoscilla sp.]
MIDFNEVRAEFQRIWGYEDFRPPQGEIIRSLLAQRDALIVMPTGGGKSICFQLPALLQSGVTLVVSPLVALMENQVQELRQLHLHGALIHSELSTRDKKKTLQALEKQQLQLLYLSPETLLSPPVWERLSQPHLKINGLILDEAHCLVQWGETFRPAYRRLGAVRSALLKSKPPGSKLPIAAFTATADPETQQIIRQVLQLRKPQPFLVNPYRGNLNLKVQIVWTPRGRRQQLLKFIQARRKQSGLVYVRTRRDSEELAGWLRESHLQTSAYHAGLSPEERRTIEKDWQSDKIQFVVCTCAFGMGINKPDVRWVIHFHSPLLLSEYVQEMGRGGRDGKPAEALILISEPTGLLDPADKQRRQFFTEKMRQQYQKAQQLAKNLPVKGNVDSVKAEFKDGPIALSLLHSSGQLKWLDPFHYKIDRAVKGQPSDQSRAALLMEKYLTTRDCRWKFLLTAFGFTPAANYRCGHCDNCSKTKS